MNTCLEDDKNERVLISKMLDSCDDGGGTVFGQIALVNILVIFLDNLIAKIT